MDAAFARTVWRLTEPVHAVTYFAEESLAANRRVGLRGYWMGYFAGRAAPMGAVGAGVVEAVFYNFHPARVRRALPDAWGFAAPGTVLGARVDAATAALRRVAPSVTAAAGEVVPLLERAVDAADGAGRPLFSANRGLPAPQDPVGALWQATTSLREHRGDGHVALLAAEGLDGCEVHVLRAECDGVSAQELRDHRGWSDEDWQAARDRLAARGLLAAGGGPTDEGRGLRTHIEARTDALATRPYRTALSPSEAARLLDVLAPVAHEVLASGLIPFPNPMGLPAPAACPPRG